MTGPDELRELRPPLIRREVLWVCVSGPDSLEDHLVLGLVAGAAGGHKLRIEWMSIVHKENVSQGYKENIVHNEYVSQS